MVDIHVIPTPGQGDLIPLIRALQHPSTRVQVCDFVPGDILEARRRAYERGTCQYVTWVNGDDKVLDIGWIDMAIYILDSYPHISAVYPRWQASRFGRVNHVVPIHAWGPTLHKNLFFHPVVNHLTVMRRYHVLDLIDVAKANVGELKNSTDRYITSAMVRYGQLISLDDIAFEWDATVRLPTDTPEALAWVRKRTQEDAVIASRLDPRNHRSTILPHAKAAVQPRPKQP